MTIDPEKPEEALAEVTTWLGSNRDVWPDGLRVVAEAAESTLPRYKEVEVWRVEYTNNNVPNLLQWLTREGTDAWADGAKALPYIGCITVTGPHKQRVPA